MGMKTQIGKSERFGCWLDGGGSADGMAHPVFKMADSRHDVRARSLIVIEL